MCFVGFLLQRLSTEIPKSATFRGQQPRKPVRCQPGRGARSRAKPDKAGGGATAAKDFELGVRYHMSPYIYSLRDYIWYPPICTLLRDYIWYRILTNSKVKDFVTSLEDESGLPRICGEAW